MPRTAAALIIGNELLSGKVQESNLLELARTLRSLGVVLRRVVMVGDDVTTIAREVSELASSHDVLFTSGGVGPTHDDLTLQAVASAFGVSVVVHPTLEGMIREHYAGSIHDGRRRLALVPEGADLLYGSKSRWPATVMRNVWMLPGIPEVFRMKLSIIREHLGGAAPFVSRAVFTQMEEPDLKELLDKVVAEYPGVEVGSYPAWSDPRYRTKITFDGTEEKEINRALESLLKLLPQGEPQWLE